MTAWFEYVYKSAFRLVYAHDGHVTRVVFIFLNLWWLMIDILAIQRGDASLAVYFTMALCSIGLINGFFLFLFRENPFLINVNYTITIFLLLSGAFSSLRAGDASATFGIYIALAILGALSSIRYALKEDRSFNAMMLKASLDVESVNRVQRN